jgi:hypothetical protein
VPALFKGKDYDNSGFIFSMISDKNKDTNLVDKMKSLLYNLQYVRRADSKSSAVLTPNIFGGVASPFTLNGAEHPFLRKTLDITNAKQAWENTEDRRYEIIYNEFEDIYFYNENIEDVLTKIMNNEKDFISATPRAWEDNEVYDNFTKTKGFTFGKQVSAGLLSNNTKKPIENSASIKDQGPNFSIPSIYSKDIDFIINVDGKDKGVKVAMSIKARVEFVSVKELTDALVDRSYDKSFMERLLDVKAGLISAKNLFIPTDLWEEYKKQLIKDDKDLLKRAEQKDNISISKSVTTKV